LRRIAICLYSALVVLLIGFGPCHAQDQAVAPPAQDIELERKLQAVDQMVMQRMQMLNMPGYCLAIIKNGKVIFQKPYGFADVNSRRPVTNQTVFGLASLTKTFTALTLLSLVDKGLINLEDPLAKYVRDLSPQYQNLTIRQLASMTAGVPKVVPQEVEWKNQLPILDKMPLQSEPGSQFLYSNFSYRLIGSVITNVTKRDYLEVVRETILNPLEMNNTATTVIMDKYGIVATAYGDNNGKSPLRQIEYKNPEVSFSAGMLASTSDDLVRYVFGLMSNKIISPKAYQTLWYERPPLSTGAASPWAFGWSVGRKEKMGGQYVISMNGGTPGVASSIIIFPESNSAVISLSNLRKPPVYQIAQKAAAIMFAPVNAQVQAPPAQEEEQTPESGSD
jgi:CubicO group peptidase (beta-lactamase class C family)